MRNCEIEQLEGSLREVLGARPEIQEAYLFGSRARGQAGAHSDVDVAVYLDLALVPDFPFGYAAELSAGLMHTLGHGNIDVIVLNQAPPLLYHRAICQGVRLLARHGPATTTREGQALSRYCDYVVQLRKIDAAHAARIARGSFGR